MMRFFGYSSLRALRFTALLFLFVATPVFAQVPGGGSAGKIGIGLTLLSPTGLTGKYILDDKKSIEAALGIMGNGFHLHGVFLYNIFALSSEMQLSLYAGGGAVIQERKEKEKLFKGFSKETYSMTPGIRAPFGISYFTDNSRIEAFAEINLNLFFGRQGGIEPGIALGARYYF